MVPKGIKYNSFCEAEPRLIFWYEKKMYEPSGLQVASE